MVSANNIGSEKEFILSGRSFMYIKKNKGPRIELFGKFLFYNTLVRERNVSCIEDFTSTLCFLLLKKDLNQHAFTPCMPQKCNLDNKILWSTQSNASLKSQKNSSNLHFFVNRLKYTSKQNHMQGQLQEKSKRFCDIQLELMRVQMFQIQHSLLFLYCGPFARKTDTTETFLWIGDSS